MITIEEVNKFLDEFKVKAKVFGIIYRDDRRKNSDALIQLGISARVRERIIFSLDGEDYSQRPNYGNLEWRSRDVGVWERP